MRKQNNHSVKKYTLYCLMLISCFGVHATGKAQTTVVYDGDRDPRYVDYTIPSGKTGQYLFFNIKGGDGGHETEDNGHSGGVGATVKGFVKIGDGNDEIPEGATLRFIPGQHGVNWGKRGGGGGGTAVAYQKSESNWVLLMVAGGGGGAGNWQDGREGTPSTSGSNGTGSTGNGLNNAGSNGQGGIDFSDDYDSGGGGGAYGDAHACSGKTGCGSKNGKAGMVDSEPKGRNGGDGGEAWGGFGFGSGGAGIKDWGVGTYYNGGGGGGYSGGGDAGSNGGGGGGGSYTNDDYMKYVTMQPNGVTQFSMDGYVKYEYTDKLSEPGTKMISLANSPDKCLGQSSGNNIELGSCNSATFGRTWIIENSIIRLNKTQYCLDLTSSKTANGTNIQIWNCNNTNAQRWVYDVNNKFIRSVVNTNKCLDLASSNATDGTNIQLYDCGYGTTKPNMQWIVDNISSNTLDGDQVRIHFAKDPSKCFDFKNASSADGTNIILYNCHYTDSQYLYFDGEQIKMKSSDKCVDVKSGSTSNGANVQLYHCTGGTAQQWIYDGFTNTFRFKKAMNMCLDVSGGNTSNGTNIQLWTCNGSDAQKWYVYK